MLTQKEQERLDDLEGKYWTMSGHNPRESDEYGELLLKHDEDYSLEELLESEDSVFQVEKINRRGLHVIDGYHGRFSIQQEEDDCRELDVSFECGKRKGESLIFDTKAEELRSELEEDIPHPNGLVDYLNETYAAAFRKD